jgi:hypothetical protein
MRPPAILGVQGRAKARRIATARMTELSWAHVDYFVLTGFGDG